MSAVGKVMWVGRAAVFLVGLAVILALVFGVASRAMGANGESLIIGNGLADTVKNIATFPTKLTMQGIKGGPALQVTQQSSNFNASGVGVTVPTGKAPLKVNADAGKATNLDADKLDGMDSAQFVQGSGKIHRYGPVIVSANGPLQELIVVGPFLIRAECGNAGTSTPTITQLMVDEAARPYSVARHTNTGFHSAPNRTEDRQDLMRNISTSVMDTTVGSVVSLAGEDRQITFSLYQHRITDPTSGAVSCTFGGYVEE